MLYMIILAHISCLTKSLLLECKALRSVEYLRCLYDTSISHLSLLSFLIADADRLIAVIPFSYHPHRFNFVRLFHRLDDGIQITVIEDII